jgi:gamma-glutamylcyclotransferase (GGCT)/AIG2-like uncharacterized protein YtfP
MKIKQDIKKITQLLAFDFLKTGQRHHEVLIQNQCQQLFQGKMSNFMLLTYGKAQRTHLVFSKDKKIDIEVYDVPAAVLKGLDIILRKEGYYREYFKQLQSWYYNLNII